MQLIEKYTIKRALGKARCLYLVHIYGVNICSPCQSYQLISQYGPGVWKQCHFNLRLSWSWGSDLAPDLEGGAPRRVSTRRTVDSEGGVVPDEWDGGGGEADQGNFVQWKWARPTLNIWRPSSGRWWTRQSFFRLACSAPSPSGAASTHSPW